MTRRAESAKRGAGAGLLADSRELSERALRILIERMEEPLGEDPDRSQRGTIVSAAARVLSHAEWLRERWEAMFSGTKEAAFFKMFTSDQECARFLLDNQETLLTLAGYRAPALVASDADPSTIQTDKVGHHGTSQSEQGCEGARDDAEAPSGRGSDQAPGR